MVKRLSQEQRIRQYIEAVERLKRGDFDLNVPVLPADGIDPLGEALRDLAYALHARDRNTHKLDRITAHINAGLLLDDVLEIVYQDFHDVIPYNRIGFALIEDDGQTVRARWAKSDQPVLKLTKGYAAPMAGSSLETIIKTGQPRILNDLLDYLKAKPDSESTALIVAEGMRSSLTCPLVANGVPVGFIFFSSIQPHVYADVHLDIFSRIADQLAVIVEKGQLVSELTAQKAAIEQQNEELRRLDELKNNFLGIAAHDLRSPIINIQLMADYLQDPTAGLTEAEKETFLNTISQQTSHLLALLNDLLDVSQIEAGQLKLNMESIDLKRFLDEAVEYHTKLAAPKSTRILLTDSVTGQVKADPVRLHQVLDNLISNAVKYSPPSSKVWVSAQRTPAGWRVNVQDEGPGITEKDRRRLFQDFARLSARPTGDEKSVGLGLAITRRIVEAHDGQIGVDSEPGQGATFWFILPNQ